MKPRRVLYVTGTRADYGLMRRTLAAIGREPGLELALAVTGMHLVPAYGLTVTEIEHDGFRIAGRVAVELDGSGGKNMALAVAGELAGLTRLFALEQPDVVLLLGDRGEMLAGALAAIHLNIPVVHLHGGERSGTVDEPVRHAISKLAHYHFVATEDARDRLVRMGELASTVHVTGAPGLDGLLESAGKCRDELCHAAGLDPARPLGLLVFHPVLQSADAAGAQVGHLLAAAREAGLQLVCVAPNADAGGRAVLAVQQDWLRHEDVRLFTHLPRDEFVSWMAAADLMLGNSSSGIIEAASFGTPVVNVGGRQHMRERNRNVVDVDDLEPDLASILCRVLGKGRYPAANVYGDGRSGPRIADLLVSLPLDEFLLRKCNAY